MAPKILIATTRRWFSAARVAIALDQKGCAAEAVCPSAHPLHLTSAVKKTYLYRALAPLRSIRAAILSSKPNLIVPCDDLAMRHLHKLYELAANSDDENSRKLCAVLKISLGDPAGYPVTESRDNFMSMLHEEGIRAPETKSDVSLEEVKRWLCQFGFPAVLKADDTSGGEGVKIVRTLSEAIESYRILRAPVSSLVVAKRACVDRDWTFVRPWLGQRKRSISVQSFVDGPDANMAVFCWEGRILASISVEVLQTWKPKGPATLVRFLENAEMCRAAEKVLRRLKFSGLCGLDFLIEKSTGDAYLIEMNPRATQTCALPLGSGRDLIASLCSSIRGQPFADMSIEMRGDTIALFPLAWHGDRNSVVFRSAYHDVPLGEPELIRTGLEQPTNLSHEKWKQLFLKLGLYEP